MMMERGKPVSGRCVHTYPITLVLLGEERRLTFLSMDNGMCLAWAAGALQQLRREGRTKVVGTWKQFWKRSFSRRSWPPSKSTFSFLYKPPMARCDSDCSAVRVSGVLATCGGAY